MLEMRFTLEGLTSPGAPSKGQQGIFPQTYGPLWAEELKGLVLFLQTVEVKHCPAEMKQGSKGLTDYAREDMSSGDLSLFIASEDRHTQGTGSSAAR